jgi:hypothetical protein
VRASVTIRLSTGGKLLAFPSRMRLAERMRIEALGYEVAEPGYRHCELAVAGVR